MVAMDENKVFCVMTKHPASDKLRGYICCSSGKLSHYHHPSNCVSNRNSRSQQAQCAPESLTKPSLAV